MALGFLGIQNNDTIGGVLDKSRGLGGGFDLLRILLALYIFYGHSIWIAGSTGLGHVIEGVANAPLNHAAGGGGGTAFTGITRPMHVGVLPMFFALSGFLVSGSAYRLRTTTTFLAFRALRILPALVVETTLCAIILGAALTKLPLSEYYSNPEFWRYFGNIVGWITMKLPGVFLSNPVSGVVNANLWTLPAEFDCYFIMAVLMATRLLYRKWLFSIVFVIATLIFAYLNLTSNFAVSPGILPAYAITYYFFMGVFIYQWKDKIPANWYAFIACGILSYALLMSQRTVFITPFFLTYCTVFFGLISMPKIPLISSGDYSYGIYLYGFPIAQMLVAVFPTIFIGHKYLLLLAALICTSSFAAFSWHFIEKRAINLKKFLPTKYFPKPAKAPA